MKLLKSLTILSALREVGPDGRDRVLNRGIDLFFTALIVQPLALSQKQDLGTLRMNNLCKTSDGCDLMLSGVLLGVDPLEFFFMAVLLAKCFEFFTPLSTAREPPADRTNASGATYDRACEHDHDGDQRIVRPEPLHRIGHSTPSLRARACMLCIRSRLRPYTVARCSSAARFATVSA